MNYKLVEKNIRYLVEKDDICYKELMQMFEQLSYDYLYIMQYYPDILELDDSFNKHVSYLEILKQSLKFIKNLNYDYYIIFKNAYKTEQINIDLNHKEGAYCAYKNNKKFINWPINHNIDDCFSLNHEFSHYLNLEKPITWTRNYFTETIAFLFEFLLYDFLDNNNYSNKEYFRIKLMKFANCYDCANEIYNYGNLINIYLTNQSLNDEIIVANYSNKVSLEQIKQQCYFYKNNIPLFENKKYLLAIFMACDIHQQILKNPNYLEKIFYLIENINKISLYDFFKELNIKIVNNNHQLNFDNDSYNRILTNLKTELDDACKRFKVLENEKNYCNCRTHSRRKDKIKY